MTEIDIYDTTQPKDPETGLPPVKARIKQRHDRKCEAHTQAQSSAAATTGSDTAVDYDGGMLDEVVVTASRSPSLWDRMKQGAALAGAIMLLAAAGWIVIKIKKR